MKNEKICTKCLMTEGTPGIQFDVSGVCNYCREYVPMQVQGEEKLLAELDKYRGSGGKHDCMVCISGGRDSTFVLWKMVHDYKMNVLAVTYKSPFLSKYAQRNVETAVEKLGVDHMYWEYPKGAHFKTTKKHLMIWNKNPSSKMIPFICAHCKSWNFEFYNIARRNKIPLIVFGSNPLETASFKQAGFGGARSYGKLSNLPKLASRSLGELYSNPSYLRADWGMVLKMYLGASHSTPYMRFRNRNISAIRLFDYLKWDAGMVEDTIRKNLDWKKSEEVEASWRFDCRLDYIRRLMYQSLTGVTELRDLYSKMIREGMLTREDAAARLEVEEKIPRPVVENVLGSFGLKLSDLNLDINDDFISE